MLVPGDHRVVGKGAVAATFSSSRLTTVDEALLLLFVFPFILGSFKTNILSMLIFKKIINFK
jgi:hypothetical protein